MRGEGEGKGRGEEKGWKNEIRIKDWKSGMESSEGEP
jgi:hypothetical protein